MFNWMHREKGNDGNPEDESFNGAMEHALEGHSTLWKERAQECAHAIRSHVKVGAEIFPTLNSVISSGIALAYTQEFPKDEWRLIAEQGLPRDTKSISAVRRDFFTWAKKKGLTNDEIQCIFKYLSEMYFYDEIQSFTHDVQGRFAKEVDLGIREGKLSDHPEYVEEAFQQWRSDTSHVKQSLTEGEEQYLWNGIEAKLLEGRTIGGSTPKEDRS